jgi:hypothetical protein
MKAFLSRTIQFGIFVNLGLQKGARGVTGHKGIRNHPKLKKHLLTYRGELPRVFGEGSMT